MIPSELHRIQTIELKAHLLFHFALQLSKIRSRKPAPDFFGKTSAAGSENFSAVNLHGIDHLQLQKTKFLSGNLHPCPCVQSTFVSSSREVCLCTLLPKLSRTFFTIFFIFFSKSPFSLRQRRELMPRIPDLVNLNLQYLSHFLKFKF